ncbi:MAG: class I SAM-dependent methyltransferase [Bradymonadaceae bacterium]
MSRYFGAHTLEGEWHTLLPRYLLLAERLKGRRVLDIGCGTGIGASLLLTMGAERVDAIDHRPAVLEIARVKHAKQGLDFHVMFWEELDFPDDTFDVVLCLDPTSPVTDPNLLLEMRRVLKDGGEYICAIERRNIDGLEKVLPRYGYAEAAETINISGTGERVPQIGELANFFETVVSVIQRPHYSFVFDLNLGAEGNAAHQARKVGKATESGLWNGDSAPNDDVAEENHPGRWLSLDSTLHKQDLEEAAVELLFCGDSHLPPPPLKEIHMPYYGLVERLQLLFADLHSRQNPGYEDAGFGELVDSPTASNPFSERESTSEFRALSPGVATAQHEHPFNQRQALDFQRPPAPAGVGTDQLNQIQHQLDQMTMLYHQVRGDMEQLFQHTRDELTERDRYIEHLVNTVHDWQHHYYQKEQGDDAVDPAESDLDRTSVFQKPDLDAIGRASEDVPLEESAEEPSTPSEATDVPEQEDPSSEPSETSEQSEDEEVKEPVPDET